MHTPYGHRLLAPKQAPAAAVLAIEQQSVKGDVLGFDLTLDETAGETMMATTELRCTLNQHLQLLLTSKLLRCM